jgi:hypothetical protein
MSWDDLPGDLHGAIYDHVDLSHLAKVATTSVAFKTAYARQLTSVRTGAITAAHQLYGEPVLRSLVSGLSKCLRGTSPVTAPSQAAARRAGIRHDHQGASANQSFPGADQPQGGLSPWRVLPTGQLTHVPEDPELILPAERPAACVDVYMSSHGPRRVTLYCWFPDGDDTVVLDGDATGTCWYIYVSSPLCVGLALAILQVCSFISYQQDLKWPCDLPLFCASASRCFVQLCLCMAFSCKPFLLKRKI